MRNKRYWDDEEDYVGRSVPQKDVYDKYRHKLYDYDEDEDDILDDDYVGDEYFEE